MDDTRDIAIRAQEGADDAHRRLDAINGQIKKLGESHEGMRTDFNRALYGEGDGSGGLVHGVIELRTTVHSALKVAGAIMGAVLVVCSGLTVYAITHIHPAARPTAPQTSPQAAASNVPSPVVASRERGSSGR